MLRPYRRSTGFGKSTNPRISSLGNDRRIATNENVTVVEGRNCMALVCAVCRAIVSIRGNGSARHTTAIVACVEVIRIAVFARFT